ncbi:MAG: hypothetical protein LBR95_00565 [Azoarcus sp.]|jgi:hypothetical protein|nr:hypothetical protein [Azoarcus sp.]
MSERQLVTFMTEGGEEIHVEVALPRGTRRRGRCRWGKRNAASRHSEVRGGARQDAPIAGGVLRAEQNLAQKPSEFELSFGIKLGAKTGLVLATLDGEANIGVKMLWKNEKQHGNEGA